MSLRARASKHSQARRMRYTTGKTGPRPKDVLRTTQREQDKFDRWADGVDAVEAELASKRRRPHVYEALMAGGLCLTCGAGEDHRYNGKRVHPKD